MSSKRERIWLVITTICIVAFGLMGISGLSQCRLHKGAVAEPPMVPLPAGQAIIYSVHENFPLEYGPGSYSRLIIADPDGKAAQVVLRGKGVISRISPSPMGKYIAFTFKGVGGSSPEEGYNPPGPVWLMSLEDGKIINISGSDARAQLVSKPPAFSQDGKLFAFGSEDGSINRTIRLFIYDIEKGELTTPSSLSQMTLEDNAPHFLLGESEIACNVKKFEGPNFGDFKRQMIAYDYGADTYRVITEFDKEDRVGVPLPGPDGKYIYYNYGKSGINHLGVRRVPVEGGKPEAVFEEKYVLYFADFIPDENKALMSYHIQEFNRRYVCVGDLETGRTKLITGDDEDISIFSEAASETGLKYVSPDGKMILTYFHDLQYDFRDIMVMDTEGGNRVNVSNTALFNEDIATWIVVPEGIEIPAGGYEVE